MKGHLDYRGGLLTQYVAENIGELGAQLARDNLSNRPGDYSGEHISAGLLYRVREEVKGEVLMGEPVTGGFPENALSPRRMKVVNDHPFCA